MFGYISVDKPYLYMKDDVLYKAMYCGVCKGISAVCGQSARMGLSYDVTFFSVLLHNVKGEDVKIEKSHCLTHRLRSRPMAEVDELTKKLGALNTVLTYYKLTDDIADGDKGRGKRLWFKKGFKRAQKAYPELCEIVKRNMQEQERVEKAKTDSVDRAADATATMIKEVSTYLLEDKATPFTEKLFYGIGKWIYLIDAVDDYDKDLKKGAYNPFILAYPAESKSQAVCKYKEDFAYIFRTLFYDIRESLSGVTFHFNRDLTDNVLLRGLPATTKRIMEGGCNDCKKQKKNSKKGE